MDQLETIEKLARDNRIEGRAFQLPPLGEDDPWDDTPTDRAMPFDRAALLVAQLYGLSSTRCTMAISRPAAASTQSCAPNPSGPAQDRQARSGGSLGGDPP